MILSFGKPSRQTAGWSRLELIVTLSTLLLLAVVTLPLQGNPRSTRSLVCLENLRHLQRAWLLYAADQSDQVPLNPSVAESMNPPPGRPGWVSGVMSWDTSMYCTNTTYLTDPRYAALSPYAGSDATLYRCPEDNYLSSAQAARGWSHRARSYAMNHFMGSSAEYIPSHRYYRRLSDFQRLSPAQAIVLLEEHPDSINDPLFIQDPSVPQWSDLPASFHGGSSWFSFADGHLEQRKWQTAPPLLPVRFSFPNLPPITSSNPDWTWLKARVSEVK